MRKIDPRNDLASYTFLSKYARYRPDLKRRETHDEAVDRVMAMHRRKYQHQIGEAVFEQVENALKQDRILPSQRTMQFAGTAIERSNLRGYNCTASAFNRPRFLAEAVWLLLCGCGVGFSVQKHHVAQLPRLHHTRGHDRHVVADSIEGWADAFDALLQSYIQSAGRVAFDYSQVRPEGAPLSTSSAKAPGPKPLRDSLEACRKLLNRVVQDGGGVLRPIDAYDLVMHAVGCVRAGGVRRSATIALFSPDDEEMRNAKTGNWFSENPQRRRSNNSAQMVRDTAEREQFGLLMQATREFGEPGVVFTQSTEHGTNPCQPGFATVLTPEGIRTFDDIDVGSKIWSESGWTTVVRKWSTGVKPVNRHRTTAGSFVGTENHRLVQAGVKVEARDVWGVDPLEGPASKFAEWGTTSVVDGLMIGDGTVHRAGGGVLLCVGRSDRTTYEEFFQSQGLDFSIYGGQDRMVRVSGYSVEESDLPLLPTRRVPSKYLRASASTKAAFLRGLYSANGSVVDNRITLKMASPTMRDDVQVMLSSLGIRSYFTTNREHDVAFENGIYTCKESYDINITSDRKAFADQIGFLHDYKMTKLNASLGLAAPHRRKSTYNITSVDPLGDHEVFDITVDNESHTYWTGGLNVSNCAEAGFDLIDETTGELGWSFCNCTSVNVAACEDRAAFLEACVDAGVLGTLQAGYMDMGYLGNDSAAGRIMRRDALLGVSLTGMADNQDIAFDTALLRAGVDLIRDANQRVAAAIGINTAARLTFLKPEGSGSLRLRVASGITPHHARRFLRYAEGGSPNDPLVRFLQKYIPDAVVQSAYDPNEVKLVFPIDLGDGPLWLKQDTAAVDHLMRVKAVQEAWVIPGTNRGDLTHNVSNTIVVKPDEWDHVENTIWRHRDVFGGVSLLGSFGDLDYPQCPFIEVLSGDEIQAKYGNDPERREKALAVADQYARLRAAWVELDWTELREDEDLTGGTEIVVCAGGACLV